MKTIFKYELKPHPSFGVQSLQMPEDAEIVDCKMLGDRMFLWAIVDPHAQIVTRMFDVYPTGGAIPVNPVRHHIATVVEKGDGNWNPEFLLWHVFEVAS